MQAKCRKRKTAGAPLGDKMLNRSVDSATKLEKLNLKNKTGYWNMSDNYPGRVATLSRIRKM
jgi:hypothetical protein